MSSKKKTSAKSKNKKNTAKKNNGFRFKAEAVFVVSVLLMLFSVLKLESFWATIHGFILGVFGFAAFPAFALSGYTSLRVAIDKFDSSTNVRVVFEGIFIYLFSAVFNVFSYDPSLSYGDFLTACYGKGVSGGGLLGGILSYPAACVFSKAGAAIIIILLLIIAVILLAVALIVTSLIQKTFVFLDQHR